MAKSGKKASTKRTGVRARAGRFVIWPDPEAAIRAGHSERTRVSAASGAVIANTTASMHEALKRLADK